MTAANHYRLSVDMNNKDSRVVQILDLIPQKSVVLDVGCANGDFGAVLKEHRDARVYGLEYNAAAVDAARQKLVFERVDQCDLDWLGESDFPGYLEKFDCIVCGDVLEHLRAPVRALTLLGRYLKPTGCIVASIPNVAHMSIKAGLMTDDFTYTSLGLLDETHIHLFTYKSIASGLADAGFRIEKCTFTHRGKLGWQPNDPYPALPVEVLRAIFSDWHSHVCQYVVKIKPSSASAIDLRVMNIEKLDINATNAPDCIKSYRDRMLGQIPPTEIEELRRELEKLVVQMQMQHMVCK